MLMSSIEAAIATGLPCFPCTEQKRPATPHGFKNATSDPAELHALWRRYPGPLVGVPTGEISGLSVLDVDSMKHPEADAWLSAHRSRLPSTRNHRTRSAGEHLVFQHTPGLRSSQGRPGRPAKGIDVRADGGYVIWWPAAGYEVLCAAPPAPWPRWLIALLYRAPLPRVPIIHDNEGELSPALRARLLRPLLRTVERAPQGQRHNVLYWAACRIGELVAARQISVASGMNELAAAATAAGWPEDEARRTIADGIARTR
jgi:hypothetical protein